MNISSLMSSSMPVEAVKAVNSDGNIGKIQIDYEDKNKQKVAKNFEAIFIQQLLSQMKNTIMDNEHSDPAFGQVDSMYWSLLSDAVAEEGGLGLWEKIYEQMPDTQKTEQLNQLLDESA